MPLQFGDRLGPYEIQDLLGIGGMGEVYRGRDTRLGRDVALKVISPRLVGDASLRSRFQVEARAASVLNHPSIVTIYDVGDTGDVSWIAMEWVDGRTLREVLVEGPLSLTEAVSIFRQIADGLAVAHARGVVHRDLKPENIMLTAEGRPKILDFGLARQTLGESLEGSMSAVATVDTPAAATSEGTIIGTVGYMSPEQASGRPVDFRSDQFSLGLIAYEMLAGQRAFTRPTAVETLSAVIRDEPAPLASVRRGTPASLQGIISRCLAKRPEGRFTATREIVSALESIGTDLSAAAALPIEISPDTTPKLAADTPPSRRHWPRRTLAVLVAAVAAVIAVATWVRYHASGGAIDSLAVLPFENASRDSDIEYLGDGLTESLINQLSRIPSLKVMARATVFRFKGAADPQDAGRKLGVAAVVAGAVSRRGGRLSISAELVEIATGARLWGEKYDRPLEDLQHVQDSIALGISNGLRLRLSVEQKRALGRRATESPEAYELFLKARHAFVTETEEGYLEARRLYLQAVAKDPKFAEAHLGIALTYASVAVEGYVPPAAAWPRVDEEIQKALALDPGNVLARCALANRRFFGNWDWAGSEREFQQLSNEPRVLLGEQFRPIALFLWARGRTDEAVELMERALEVDPGNLTSKNMLADLLAQAGRLEAALSLYRAVLEAEPSNPRPLFGVAEVLKRRGDMAGAIGALRKAYELSLGEEAAAKALAAAHTQKDYEKVEEDVARFRLGELEDLARERYVSPLDLARLNARVGESAKAFSSLEAAFAERSAGLVYLKVDQAWDRIRDDPRFASLVRRIGIP